MIADSTISANEVFDTVAIQENDYTSGDETTGEEDVIDNTDSLQLEWRKISPDSVLTISGDKGFYYRNYLDSLLRASQPEPLIQKKPKKRVSSRNLFDSVFGVIFWILAIGLFGYLVYKLFLSNSSLFSRSRKNIAADIAIEETENTGDPDSMLRNAIRNGNYRLAVRYLYLQTLTRLAEKKLITISSSKTNYEYLNELRKHSFANEFAMLTLKYEYIWYGEYPVDENLFQQLEENFSRFNKTITR